MKMILLAAAISGLAGFGYGRFTNDPINQPTLIKVYRYKNSKLIEFYALANDSLVKKYEVEHGTQSIIPR